jgi:hypothetical protein
LNRAPGSHRTPRHADATSSKTFNTGFVRAYSSAVAPSDMSKRYARYLPLQFGGFVLGDSAQLKTAAHTSNQLWVDGSRIHVAREVWEMLAYLGRSSYWTPGDCDSGSKHQRFFRGADDAVVRQSAQRSPIDGTGRSLVQFDHD